MAVGIIKASNVEIKSNGARHSVFVGGVQMDFVTKVTVEYKHGEVARAVIEVMMPDAITKVEAKPHD